jgi:hypothetical protein
MHDDAQSPGLSLVKKIARVARGRRAKKKKSKRKKAYFFIRRLPR